MGRSVDYLDCPTFVTFTHLEYDGEDDDWTWDDFVKNVQYGLEAIAPSLVHRRKWDNRETVIILENNHCVIGVSEYCGLVSISIRHSTGLGLAWVNKMWPKMKDKIAEMYPLLRKIATMSNGEAIFEEVKPAPLFKFKP